jgi:branched-chain amino acid transport system ATP-binding protein
MLRVDNLHAGYGPVEVLKGVSLAVNEGEIVTVLGANGAGKSTLLMTVCGVNHVRRGSIQFRGAEVANLPPHDIVARGIVQVPEGRRIFPRLTVAENLEMGAFQRRDGEIHKDIARAFELFPILKERQRQLGGTLSGGEQQMLAIARALMARPKLLLMDEPSLGLAPKIVAQIFQIIREIQQRGATILLVEQNAHMALRVANRAYVMQTGRIVLEGSGEELLRSEEVRKAYLGE